MSLAVLSCRDNFQLIHGLITIEVVTMLNLAQQQNFATVIVFDQSLIPLFIQPF